MLLATILSITSAASFWHVAIATPLAVNSPQPRAVSLADYDELSAYFSGVFNVTSDGEASHLLHNLQTRQANSWRPSYTGTFNCPTAGSLSRLQQYEYTADTRVTNTRNIVNADRFTLFGDGTELQVLHRFTQSFGNRVCCYAMAHVVRLDAFDDHPILEGSGAMNELCLDVGANQCTTVDVVNCPSTSRQFSFVRA